VLTAVIGSGCGARTAPQVLSVLEMNNIEVEAFDRRCSESASAIPPADPLVGEWVGYMRDAPFQLGDGGSANPFGLGVFIADTHRISRLPSSSSPFVWEVCQLAPAREPPWRPVREHFSDRCALRLWAMVESPQIGFNNGGRAGPRTGGSDLIVQSSSFDLRGDCLRYSVELRYADLPPFTAVGFTIDFIGIRHR
jgi:hypothetical protein